MSGEGAIEHPLSTHSAPFGTRWKPAGNKYSISMRSFTRLAAMVTLLLTLACGNVWADDRGFWTSEGGYVRFYRNSSSEYGCTVNGTGTSDFNLGNIDSDGGLIFTDLWAKTWGGHNDIWSKITFRYRVKVQDSDPGVDNFSEYDLDWGNNFNTGDQYWHKTMLSVTCPTTGLAAGNYEVEFQWRGYGTDVKTYWLSNNSGNYHANFTLRRKITYHDDGKTGGSKPSDEWFSTATATVKDNTGLMVKTGQVFAGWATSSDRATSKIIDYAPGATFTITEDVDLYPVWTNGSYFISLTGPTTNGVKNTTDFYSSNSLTNTAVEVNGVTFSKSYYKTSANQSSIKQQYQNAGNFIVYDTKSTSTTIRVYVKNTHTSAATVYYYTAKEGSTSETDQSVSLSAGETKMFSFDASNSKGTRVILCDNQYSKVFFTQIIAIETGTTLPLPGEPNYELAFPGRVASHFKTINGIEVAGESSNLKWNYDVELRLQSGSSKYVKFTTPASPSQMLLTTLSGKGGYVCTDKNNPSTTGVYFPSVSKTTEHKINLSASTTYYIMGETSSNTCISKIAFTDATTITYDANEGSGSMGSSKNIVSSNSFTPPSGKTFVNWNTKANGTGIPYAPGDYAYSDVKLYAQWGYALTYDKNTTDEVSNMPTTPVGVNAGSITLASEIPVRSGYVFVGWQVGGSGTIYQSGSSYTMPSSAVTMKAKWVAEDMYISDARKSSSWGSDKTAGIEITSTNIKGTISGGTVVCSNSSGSLGGNDNYGLVFDENIDQITITVTGKTFSEGSVIVLEGYSVNSNSKTVGFTASTNAFIQGNYTTTAAEYQKFRRTYIVTSGDGIINTSSFTLERSTSNKVYLYSLQVGGCEEPSCTTPTIAWSTSPTNGNVGGNMTISVTSNYPAGVTIASNNSNATLTGRTIAGSTVSYTLNYAVAGNANITASVDGDGSTVCDETVNLDAVAITISKNTPAQYEVSGTAAICSGGNTDITLANSQTGASYQLKKNGVAQGEPKAGETGSALTWNVSAAGTYTVSAVETTKYTARDMTGSATVSIYDAVSIGTQPTASVNATVSSAASLSGLALGSGTYNSPAYQWQTCKSDGSSASDITSGSAYANYTTATLSFTPGSAGTYYFKCKVTDGCSNTVSSNVVTVTAKNQPAQYTVSGTASICSGSNTNITLSDSEDGITYKLYKGGVAEGDPKDGTGEALTWSVSAEGTYTVKAVGDANYWERAMSGSATVSFKTATSISTQPATAVDATVSEDFTLGSALVAAGDGTLQYQWFSYSNAAGDADETSVRSASTTKTFTTSKAVAGTYYYRVKVIGGCGTVASDVIVVTVSACSPTTLISATLSSCSSTGDVTGTPGGSSAVEFSSCKELDGGYKMGKDDSYMYLTLSSGKFEAGDKVSITITKANDGVGDGALHVYKYMSSTWTELGSTPASTAGTFTYTLTAANVATDFNCIGLYRQDGNQNPYIKSLTITRPCSGYAITNGEPSHGTIAITDGSSAITTAEEDATVHIEATPADGYSFGEWTVTKDAGGSIDVATSSSTNPTTFSMPGEDVTVTASFTPNTYTITYNLNGASWASSAGVASYTVGTGATLPISSNMTNTGYTFGGWYDNSGLTGSSVTAISTSDYGNKEYWAKWTENTYAITYKKNGDGAGNDGDVTGSTSSTNGHYVTVADNGFALASHVFAGWNTAANGSGESYSEGEEIELTDNMTLYAIWADDYNVTWGNVQIGGAGDAVTPNLGGKNYTITATIATWTGDVTDIELGDITSGVTASITGTTSSPSKTVTITFAVGTSVVGSSINLSLNVPAHGDYGVKTSTKAITIDRCTGGKDEIRFISSNKNDAGDNFADMSTTKNTTQYVGSDIAKLIATGSAGLNLANNKIGYRFDRLNVVFKLTTTTTLDVYYNANATNKTFALYSFSSDKELSAIGTSDYSTKSIVSSGITVTNVSFSEGSKSTPAGTNSVSSGVVKLVTAGGIKASYASLAAGYYVLISGSGEEGYLYGLDITGGSGSGKITPTLTWSPLVSSDAAWDGVNNRLNKRTSDADFTFTATQDKNSLGAITYASSNTSVVTVNATTGKVHVEGAGDATITATLAESGCYNKATATYAIHVVDDCDDEAGTISTEDLGCDGIRMTVTGHTTSGETVNYQWYKDGVSLGSASGAQTATYTATTAGEYYVIVTNTGDRHCAKTSTNTVVIAAKAAVTASKIVDSWYVKNGRRTPDIALVQTTNTTDFTVAFKGSTTIWDPTNSVSTGFGGCPFRLGTDGIIYLDGQSSLRAVPTGMTVGDTTITITAKGCGAGNNQSVDIKLHVQAKTAHPSVAYVSLGTAAGAVTDTTAGYYKTAALYKYLDNTLGGGDFDLTAQNAYWSVDEKELKQHYSQFDAILITDDPSTDKSKKVDGKDYSYINAIGCLIDVRPILTMEAYVAKRDNWKAKGITGTPESPNPRQYGMKLQCKQHAIFSGVNSASSNVEVETIDGVDYWTVLMVDSTKSPYTDVAWNDQTAGNQKPALQGFAASSVSEDLLLLGEIKDGALYAGVERQTEPAARLLVLGINAKALPSALTAEGKLILKNSLNYLLETDLEKVDDCSNYFTGATDSDWNKATNWSKGQVPNSPTIRVRILKPCEISSGTPIKAASVDIATSGKSYHLSGGTCSGKLTINAGGALIVGGEVRSAVAPNFNSVNLKPTTEDDLILNTSSTAQSALILNNDKGDTKATVNLYSLGRYKDDAYQFQYFAVPMTYLDINPAFAGQGIYTYVWTEASGWERRGYYKGLEAFEGVGITTTFTEAKTYQMKGTLASTEEREITLTTGGAGAGQNIIGNSWLAPIDIASLKSALLEEDVDEVVYIYCTGNDGDAVSSGGSETPGQWLAIPIDASGWEGWSGLKVIPAMQGFCIIANSETTLTLNYNDHVRSTASDKLTPYLRAPKREASHEGIDLIRIRVADSQTHTDLYLFEGESFSEEFDNGWEAKYMSGDGRSANLYAETAIGPMAVVAQPEYEGTVLGFAPGKETEYTFTFSGPNKEYYLNDLKEKKSTLISEDESYMFTFEEGDTNRFYISKTPINAPSVATGTENTGDGVKARKVLVNDKLYIILNGRVYSAEGVMVK